MGVCEGPPRSILPDHMGRADYFGDSVNMAARFMDAGAHGGQVVCEEGFAQSLVQRWEASIVEAERLAAAAAAAAAARAIAQAAVAAARAESASHKHDRIPTLRKPRALSASSAAPPQLHVLSPSGDAQHNPTSRFAGLVGRPPLPHYPPPLMTVLESNQEADSNRTSPPEPGGFASLPLPNVSGPSEGSPLVSAGAARPVTKGPRVLGPAAVPPSSRSAAQLQPHSAPTDNRDMNMAVTGAGGSAPSTGDAGGAMIGAACAVPAYALSAETGAALGLPGPAANGDSGGAATGAACAVQAGAQQGDAGGAGALVMQSSDPMPRTRGGIWSSESDTDSALALSVVLLVIAAGLVGVTSVFSRVRGAAS